jgi:hypothetical protein
MHKKKFKLINVHISVNIKRMLQKLFLSMIGCTESGVKKSAGEGRTGVVARAR